MEGEELSWTLGKILLFASSQIEPKEGDTEAKQIGIYPSQISGHKFVPVVSCYLVMVIIQLTMKMMIWVVNLVIYYTR